jgi:hypothetical protein
VKKVYTTKEKSNGQANENSVLILYGKRTPIYINEDKNKLKQNTC